MKWSLAGGGGRDGAEANGGQNARRGGGCLSWDAEVDGRGRRIEKMVGWLGFEAEAEAAQHCAAASILCAGRSSFNRLWDLGDKTNDGPGPEPFSIAVS